MLKASDKCKRYVALSVDRNATNMNLFLCLFDNDHSRECTEKIGFIHFYVMNFEFKTMQIWVSF